MINLVNDSITKGDINALCSWLKTGPQLTQGEKVREFEGAFAKWQGRKYATFVNSGSSANLIMAYMIKRKLNSKREKPVVVVPALCWSTTLAPFVQLGFDVIFCDCNKQDLSVNIGQLRDIIERNKPDAFIHVSVLGLPPEIAAIKSLCENNGVIFVEDACESMGSAINGKKIGCFGQISSFSTYYGHHMTTVEGGFVTVDDESFDYQIKMLRAHGWNRDLSNESKRLLRQNNLIDDPFRDRFTFYVPGFNMRSTEISAFLGLKQLPRLNDSVKRRQENYYLYDKLIKNDYWKPLINEDMGILTISNMGYPIIHPNIKRIVALLKKAGVDCRPLIAGSITEHPYIKLGIPRCKYGNIANIKFAKEIYQNGIYIPNHPELTKRQVEMISAIVNKVTA